MNDQLTQREKAAPLFEDWQETMIWSCLQGIMGEIYVDSPERPASGVALLGDFCFLAGKPDQGLMMDLPEIVGPKSRHSVLSGTAGWDSHHSVFPGNVGQDSRHGVLPGTAGQKSEEDKGGFCILVPQNQQWADLIEECLGEQVKRVVRYAIKKEPDVFDRKALQAVVDGLPDGYILKEMDEPLFWKCRGTGWCRDWVAQYENYALYKKYGLGVVILKDGEPVSGASSYSGYVGGIEVEIDTRQDFRRRGLAYVCGAKLILECLARGWYPSWDAQNLWSVGLAEKLGYHFDREYVAFEWVKL